MSTRRTFLSQAALAGVMAGVGMRIARSEAEAALQRAVMKTYKIPHTELTVSRIAYGCDKLAAWNREPIVAADLPKAVRLVNVAHENGITLFDHADLYGFGRAEAVFGEVLKQSPGLRERIVIQTKCGQVFPEGWKGGRIHIDVTREHIVSSAEGSLRRLGTDRLDILLLHVADTLVQPEEVATAFDTLHRTGKVRYFGVSNHNAAQIQLLKKSVRQPIIVNQVPVSLAHPNLIVDGMSFALGLTKGTSTQEYPSFSGPGTFEYCRLHDIQIQAYAPLRGVLNPPADAKPQLKQTAQLLKDLADKKKTNPSAVALAWLLRHPAGILPVIGANKPEYIIENCVADRVSLSAEEWYSLFAAATASQLRSG